jgi:5-formyltetrahydrofolate cyclo-ligase
MLPEEPVRGVKRLLRAQVLAERSARTAAQIEDARAGVRAYVLARFGSSRTVAAYRPMRTEPGSVELLEALSALGVRVIVPLVLDDRDLDWTPWPGGDPLGTDAVAGADLVLVPALAVDRRGNRLGRGGGSYDRALLRVSAGVPTVALLYDGEVVDELPAEPWDVPVAAAVTPSGWHRFV